MSTAFGAPVADQIAPPTAGLQTLSNLLGLKQQQLGIARQQIGLSQAQQELSQQTSQATMAGIQANQQQALQQVDWKQYVNPDGSLNVAAAQQKALQVAPNIGPEFISRLEAMSQGGAQTKQAFHHLGQSLQSGVRAAFGAWAADPKAKVTDLAATLEDMASNEPKSTRAQLEQIMGHSMRIIGGVNPVTGQPMTPEQQKAAAMAFARSGLTPGETVGSGGIAEPTPTTLNTGGAVLTGAQAPVASGQPGQFEQKGAEIPTTMQPHVITQPGTNAQYVVWPNGSVTPVGAPGAPQGTHPGVGQSQNAGTAGAQGVPGGPQSAQAGAPQQNWWQPSPGQAQYLAGNVQALVQRTQAGEAAANSAPTAIDALERSRAILAKGVWTGTQFSMFKDLKNTMASLGVDTKGAQNASELAKNLARYEASRAGTVGQTDAARSLYEAGAPNTKMDPASVRSVILQSLGVERMIQGYGKLMTTAPNPQVALQREQAFRSVPHLVMAYELGFMKNAKEADELFKRYGVSGPELAKSAAELKKLGVL